MNTTPTADAYEIKGRLYLRVTSFLSAVGASDFSSIPEKDRQFYLDRGTARHDLFQKVEEGTDGGFEFDPRVEAYRAGHAKFLKETGFKAIPGGIEKRVHATWEELGLPDIDINGYAGLAGTMDRLGTIPRSRIALIDFKGEAIPKSTAAQTAVYAMLLIARTVGYKFHEIERYGIGIDNRGGYAMSTRYPNSDRDDVLYHLHQYRKEAHHVAH